MQRVLHSLDLAMLGDWEGAKRVLEHLDDPIVSRLIALMTEQQRRENERAQKLSISRHELGNALSIAQANVEAMVDGVLEPTRERLSGIRDALQHCGALLVDLKKHSPRSPDCKARHEAFNICELIGTQARLVSTIAESKNVSVSSEVCEINDGSCTYSGDPQSIAHSIRHILLSAVRFTPPGGDIKTGCVHPNDELLISVRDSDATARSSGLGLAVLAKMLETIGGQARMVEDAGRASFFISLPAIALTS
jgi:two-component system, OmpR family, sensor histidine kinase BaeS